MKLPFRRDNSDNPVLMRDLEALSEAYRHGAEPPMGREASTSDVVAGVLIEDGYVRGFARAVIHVRRYLPFYGVAVALLLVFAAVAPVTDGAEAPVRQLAQGVGAERVDAGNTGDGADASTDAAVEVVVPAFSGGPAPFEAAGPTAEGTASGSGLSPASPSSASEPATTVPARDATRPQPLRVTASGYASVSGGTPFEIEPADGALPVSAGAGEPGRISFIKVAGDDQKLRLREVEGSVNGEGASIRACLITEDWTPERGQAMSDAPAYDANLCSTGARDSDGLWTFDLLTFTNVSGFGLALVPGPAAAPPTFDVASAPTALPPAGSAA